MSGGPFQDDFQCPDDVGRVHQGTPDLFRRKVASPLRRYLKLDQDVSSTMGLYGAGLLAHVADGVYCAVKEPADLSATYELLLRSSRNQSCFSAS